MKKVLFMAVSAFGILAMGCNKEANIESETGSASLTITINSEASSAGRATGVPLNADENKVHSFVVCVFHNTSGAKERIEVFNNVLVGEIKDLQVSYAKKVVVLVNADVPSITSVSNYSELAAKMLELETQDPANLATDGLFMSGEASGVTLTAGETAKISIPVRRVVAKIQLASLTVTPDANSTLSKFTLKGVSVQKVPKHAFMLANTVPTLTLSDYRGGLAGDVSTVIPMNPTLLYTAYAPAITSGTKMEPEIYFYVLPNDDSAGNATMVTIHGEYDGVTAYYPFVVNGDATTGGDGTYITRNKIYTLNVTLKRLSNYSDDAETESAQGDLEVTVVPVNWEGDLIQVLEW